MLLLNIGRDKSKTHVVDTQKRRFFSAPQTHVYIDCNENKHIFYAQKICLTGPMILQANVDSRASIYNKTSKIRTFDLSKYWLIRNRFLTQLIQRIGPIHDLLLL